MPPSRLQELPLLIRVIGVHLWRLFLAPRAYCRQDTGHPRPC